MSRIVYCTASTLDGYLADEQDSLDWLFRVPGADDATAFAGFLAGVGVLVMGSTTYRWVHDFENLREHPERWTDAYADRPVFVFTTRPQPLIAGADVRFVSGSVDEQMADILAVAGGRDVWIVGGGDLAGQFADIDRLDEIVITYAPAVVGAGRPLLPRRIEADRLRIAAVDRDGPFAQITVTVSPSTTSRT